MSTTIEVTFLRYTEDVVVCQSLTLWMDLGVGSKVLDFRDGSFILLLAVFSNSFHVALKLLSALLLSLCTASVFEM